MKPVAYGYSLQQKMIWQAQLQKSLKGGTFNTRMVVSPYFSGKDPKQVENTLQTGEKPNRRPSWFQLPISLLALLGSFSPWVGVTVKAASDNPTNAPVVQCLESKDEALVEASILNLSSVGDKSALPTILRILSQASGEHDTIQSAIKALGRYGEKATPQEKTEFSKLILPYLLKVTVSDKNKNTEFYNFLDAEEAWDEHSAIHVDDQGMAAARAIGKIGDPLVLSRLLKAAQDPMIPRDVRWLSLEALKYTAPNEQMDKELTAYMDLLSPEDYPDLLLQTSEILLRHQSKEGLVKVEKLLQDSLLKEQDASSSEKQYLVRRFPELKRVVNLLNDEMQDGGVDDKTANSYTFDIPEEMRGIVLKSNNPGVANMMFRLMAAHPINFRSKAVFSQVVERFKTLPPDARKQLSDLFLAKNAEKLIRETLFPETLKNPTDVKTATHNKADADEDEERKKVASGAKEAKIGLKIGAESDDMKKTLKETIPKLRTLVLSLMSSMNVKEYAPIYQEIYTNPLESEGFRHLALVGSAQLKDETALKPLMDLTVDETETADLRHDALSAALDILSPPLAPGVSEDLEKVNSIQQYANTFLEGKNLTKSFYKAALFSDIREVRKVLLNQNASAEEVDGATLKLIDSHLQELRSLSDKRQKWFSSEEFKTYQSKMLDYIGKNKNADGFLRILMMETLGHSQSPEARPILKELVKDPLARTQIPDISTSNDLVMFPGYTKYTVANTTRLSALHSLGKLGVMEDTDLVVKGLMSDDKRVHYAAITALEGIGKNTERQTDSETLEKRQALRGFLLKRLPQLDLEGTDRLNNYYKKLYAQAIDALGGGNELLQMMDKTEDTVLRRAIANGLIHRGENLHSPKVAQYLLSTSLGVDVLHQQGIDGRGTEMAIIDGDYINDDIDGLQGKIVYPEWGRLHDASLRKSFHGEAVASVIAGKNASITYGLAPGVEKIYSYAAWEGNMDPNADSSIEEQGGIVRALDDIIAKKMSGKSKVSVVNMSLGGTSGLLYGTETTMKAFSQKLGARCQLAKEAGITIVISAGNERGDEVRHHLVGTLNDLGFTQENGNLMQSKGVILVGALDNRGTQDPSKHKVAFFSSVGDAFNSTQPNVLATGTNLPLVDRDHEGNICLDEEDGTSFSSPITAATILLMNQANGNPLETEMIKSILAKTAYQLPDTPNFMQGEGAIDSVKAVEATKNLVKKESSTLKGFVERFKERIN